MIAVLDPSPRGLSQLYDRERPPFRLTRKTLLAVGVVGAMHLGIGLVIAHAYFAPPPQNRPATTILVDTIRMPLPKPPVDHKVAPSTPRDPQVAAFVPHDLPTTSVPTDVGAGPVIPESVGSDIGVGPLTPSHVEPLPQPPLPKAPPVIANPDWLSRPTADQIGKLYPVRALQREMGGKATLLCEVQATGAVSNCDIVEETPKGYRFGEAAQAMTKYFKLSPRTVDGVSVAGSKVRIPIVFNAT